LGLLEKIFGRKFEDKMGNLRKLQDEEHRIIYIPPLLVCKSKEPELGGTCDNYIRIESAIQNSGQKTTVGQVT